MKYQKLNARGFSHDLVLLAFVLIFAVVGVGYLVTSHAQNIKGAKVQVVKPKQNTVSNNSKVRVLDPQPTIPQPIVDNSEAGATTSGFDGVGPTPTHTGLNMAITAKGQLGSSNQPKYNGPDGEWCAAFATWVARYSGSGMPHLTSASSIKSWGVANRRWHTTRPRVGDIAVYGSLHVGIVVSSDGVNIKEVDGNWGNRLSYHLSGSDSGGPIKDKYSNFYTSGQPISGFVSL
jgi:hypothetical protein